MITQEDHARQLPSRGNYLRQLGEFQLAWTQLFWRLSLGAWSSSWFARPPVPSVTDHTAAPGEHSQLAVPPTVATDGEPALFA